MDSRDLTQALRDATEDLTPRDGFAGDVVAGGRRRRRRNRVAMASAVVGTAAVAAIAMTGPTPLSAPPAPGASQQTEPSQDWRMSYQGGEHVDDPLRVTEIIEAWTTGLRAGRPANQNGTFDDRPGDPHVYWAGDTINGYGEAAIVMEVVRLSPDDERILTGVVATPPNTTAPRLLGLQLDGPGEQGQFVLPDNRTVVAVARPGTELWLSREITYTDEGSQRHWMPYEATDGVVVQDLYDNSNKLNVRLVAGAEPTPENMDPDRIRPLVMTGRDAVPTARGLPWDRTIDLGANDAASSVGDRFDASAEFTKALRDSGQLDPWSYQERRSPWLVMARVQDGVLMIGEHQELDEAAYVYVAMPRGDGGYDVRRAGTTDHSLPVAVRLPDNGGYVVAAFGEELTYRTGWDGVWSAPFRDAGLVPPEATHVQAGDHFLDLANAK